MIRHLIQALLVFIATAANGFGRARDVVSASATARGDRGQLGIFMVLVFGAVSLVVVTIVLLFGMQIAGDFADGILDDGDPFTVNNETFSASSTGQFDYSVNRQPDSGDTLSLNDDETVFNRSNSTQLTEGTHYEFFPDNGTVRILNTNDATAEFNITYTGEEATYAAESRNTVNSTGNAFRLFGTSVLVIPAAAVLAVLIGGLIGAVTMVGAGGALPGVGGGRRGRSGR